MSWLLKDLSGNVLWTGETSLTTKKLTQILIEINENNLNNEITFITLQILQNTSLKLLPSLLSLLICYKNKINNNNNIIIDISPLNTLKNINTSTICGKRLKKGEIIWTCRQCSHDSTCVQCNDCFQLSNHEGHEVYFYKSSDGGGCCDCGDYEAWNEAGTCSKHKPQQETTSLSTSLNSQNNDPTNTLPENLIIGFNSVLHAIILFFVNLINHNTESFNNINNIFSKNQNETNEIKEIILRLHNDDIHSYDDVTSALSEVGLSSIEAQQNTVAVDKVGHAAIKNTSNKTELIRVWEILAQKSSLLVSITNSKIIKYEEIANFILQWLQQTVSSNLGLLRLVTNAFIEPISSVYSRTNNQILQYLDFPNITYPTLYLRHNLPTADKPLSIQLPAGVDGTSSINSELLQLNPFGFNSNQETINHNHNHTPMSVLSLLIGSSPYLIKELQLQLHNFIIFGIRDPLFKLSYSQLFLHLYPHLLFLQCHGIGTNKESLFQTTVQIFTADSIIDMLSSTNYLNSSRPIPEPTLISNSNFYSYSIVPVLISSLATLLKQAGFTIDRTTDDVSLHSFIVRSRKYSTVLHDLGFVMGCGNLSKEFFLMTNNNGISPVYFHSYFHSFIYLSIFIIIIYFNILFYFRLMNI